MATKDKGKKDRLPRGSVPPMLPLSDAVQITRDIYERAAGEASYDMLSTIMNNSPGSSSFVKKLAAIKNYGIVVEENKIVKVSALGRGIVAPKDEFEHAMSKKEAFLNIETFEKIYNRYKGKLLPQDEFLLNIFSEYVPKDLAPTWLDKFKRSAFEADLIVDRGEGKLQVRESLHVPHGEKQESPIKENEKAKEVQSDERRERITKQSYDDDEKIYNSGHVSRISLSGGRQAIFSLPDRLTNKDAQKLKGALQGFSAIIDSMVDEDDEDTKAGNDAG